MRRRIQTVKLLASATGYPLGNRATISRHYADNRVVLHWPLLRDSIPPSQCGSPRYRAALKPDIDLPRSDVLTTVYFILRRSAITINGVA